MAGPFKGVFVRIFVKHSVVGDELEGCEVLQHA